MTKLRLKQHLPDLTLGAATASELMVPNPVSIRDNATVQEATVLLIDKGFSAAPVIDEAGRPIGVVSRSDVLTHDREKGEYLSPVPFYEEEAPQGQKEVFRPGYQIVDVDRTRVRDIMTPVVFSVGPHTAAREVVRQLTSLKVHRLFVVDRDGVLVGVISTLDVLRHLE
jgi:CBS-domain-containing membrane protein